MFRQQLVAFFELKTQEEMFLVVVWIATQLMLCICGMMLVWLAADWRRQQPLSVTKLMYYYYWQ